MEKTLAFDIAANYEPNLWVNGSNLGFGFDPWVFDFITNGSTQFAGAFIGDPALAGINGLGTNSFAFALYANPYGSGANATVTRPFTANMQIGDIFTIDVGLNWDSAYADSFRGFELYSDTTPVLEVYGSNNDNVYLNNNIDFDNIMFDNYGTNAMRLSFKLIDSTTMSVSGIGRDGVEVFNQNVSIAAPPNKISFYFEETDNTINRQMYFDRLNLYNFQLEESPTPTPTQTNTPTPTQTNTPTESLTPTPTVTVSETPSSSTTPTPTPTPTPNLQPLSPVEERNAKYATENESGEKRFRRLFGLGYV